MTFKTSLDYADLPMIQCLKNLFNVAYG